MGRLDNVLSIPERSLHTVALGGIDVLNTVDGVAQDITSVVLNTKHKIFDLFSNELKRYHKALNIPVAVGVGAAGALEAVLKPIVNGVVNTGKTGANIVTNARKSTFGSLFSTKPVSDISFNSLKRKGHDVHIDTTKPARKRNRLWSENRGFLTSDKKREYYERKLRELGATT